MRSIILVALTMACATAQPRTSSFDGAQPYGVRIAASSDKSAAELTWRPTAGLAVVEWYVDNRLYDRSNIDGAEGRSHIAIPRGSASIRARLQLAGDIPLSTPTVILALVQ